MSRVCARCHGVCDEVAMGCVEDLPVRGSMSRWLSLCSARDAAPRTVVSARQLWLGSISVFGKTFSRDSGAASPDSRQSPLSVSMYNGPLEYRYHILYFVLGETPVRGNWHDDSGKPTPG